VADLILTKITLTQISILRKRDSIIFDTYVIIISMSVQKLEKMALETNAHSWVSYLGFFAIAILPNLYIVDITETRIVRAYLYLVIAIILLVIQSENVLADFQNVSLAKRLFIYIAIALTLISLASVFDDPVALFGDMIMPLGSITFIASLFCGVLLAYSLPSKLIIKAIISGAWIAVGICITMMLAGTASAGYRAEAFFDHSLAFALYLSVATLFSIHEHVKNSNYKLTNWLEPIIFIGFIGLSGSRVALLTTFLIIVIYLSLSARWTISKPKKILIFSGIVLSLIPSFILLGRLRNMSYAIESVYYRLSLWQRGLKIISQNLWGVGFGNIGQHFYSLDLPSWLLEPYHRHIIIESSHNIWIDIGIGYGLPIAIFFASLTIWSIYKTFKNHKRNYIFGLIYILIILNLTTMPASTITLILLGILSGLTVKPHASIDSNAC
jgi:hypothetical protein